MLRIGILSFGRVIFVSFLSFPIALQAAEVPKAGTILKQQEQREQERKLPKQIPEVEKESKETKAAIKEESGQQVTLKEVVFTGSKGPIPQEQLQAQVADALDKSQGIEQIKYLATKISNYYRSQGYLLVQAYLPQQDVTDGILEISIIDGRLDGAKNQLLELKKENLRIKPEHIQNIASSNLSTDSSVKTIDLERTLLLINDLPGISAQATIKAGSKPGTTRIVADVKEDDLVSGVVWVDNYGSRYSGSTSLNGQININDPLQVGDRLNGNISVAKDQNSLGANYSLPLGSDGVRMTGGVSYLNYKVGKELSASKAEGDALTLNLGVSYPLIRTRMRNIYLSGTYNNKETEDKISGITTSKRKINSLQLTVSADQIDRVKGGGYNFGSLTLTSGRSDLSGNESDYQSDRLTAQVHGNYSTLNGQVARLQRISNSFTLLGQLQGQLADGNLDSSEQFSLGGPTGIRAYPVGEASGDEGVMINAELRYDLAKVFDYGKVQLTGFVDYGAIRLNKNPWTNSVATATGKNGYHLAGVGFGASLTKSEEYNIKLQIAAPTGDNDGRDSNNKDSDGKSQNIRFWLTASYQF